MGLRRSSLGFCPAYFYYKTLRDELHRRTIQPPSRTKHANFWVTEFGAEFAAVLPRSAPLCSVIQEAPKAAERSRNSVFRTTKA